MADSLDPQPSDAIPADDIESAPPPSATRAYCVSSDSGSVAIACSTLDDRAHYVVELRVELTVPLGVPGGITIPLSVDQSFELAGPEQAKQLAAWIRAQTETKAPEQAANGSGEGSQTGVLRHTIADQFVRIHLEHNRATDQLRYRVTTDGLPVELPMPNPWSPCKVALWVHEQVELSPQALTGLAAWIEHNIA